MHDKFFKPGEQYVENLQFLNPIEFLGSRTVEGRDLHLFHSDIHLDHNRGCDRDAEVWEMVDADRADI